LLQLGVQTVQIYRLCLLDTDVFGLRGYRHRDVDVYLDTEG